METLKPARCGLRSDGADENLYTWAFLPQTSASCPDQDRGARYVLSELRRLAEGRGSGGAQVCLALLEGAVRPDHLLEVLLAELGHGRRPAGHQAIHDTLFAYGVRVPVARHRVGLLLDRWLIMRVMAMPAGTKASTTAMSKLPM